MRQPAIDPIYFMFRSTIKGLLWSAIGIQIALWIIWMIYFSSSMLVPAIINEFNSFKGVIYILGGIIYIAFESILFSMMTFLIIGIIATILPCVCASLITSILMYYENKKNRLSEIRGKLIGGIIGCISGLSILFFPLPLVSFLQRIWFSFSQNEETLVVFWAMLIVIPITATITGSLFGKSLVKEFEPIGDYFSIDWEALQREEEQYNLTPDTSTHDI